MLSGPQARSRPLAAHAAAGAIALLAAAYTYYCLATTVIPSDFEFWWRAARLYLAGGDPYLQLPGTPAWPLPDRFYYPMPTVLATIPVAWMPLPAAGATLMGLASGALASLLVRGGWWRLWALAGPGFIMALKFGQWTPLLCVAYLAPRAGGLAVLKPTLGAALLAARWNVRGALVATLVALLSVAALPTWPMAWLRNLDHVHAHPAPVTTAIGAFALLALLRWRRPEAWLLALYACVPQLLFFADQLPLALVARTKGEAQLLAACGLTAWLVWMARLETGDLFVLAAAPYVLVGLYLPALLLVLRRPNDGALPVWADAAWMRSRALVARARVARVR
ncbi:hypothetical protein [Roseisolibacter agri]|uniref:Uncharacterized protein n=1 Tax=Roseisolibacter agri TaxID=2014610 RepID=A0AA37Q8K6_9BACT|nr:hypothetical protein [Roseisolibacter agri]GLC26692.1 hypothetical protein rosag_32050 [Roseisolibacter agri]